MLRARQGMIETRRRLRRIRDRRGRPFPTAMQLEITNRCNLSCRMCPLHGGDEPARPVGSMELPEIQRLIREFARGGGRLVIPHGGGEPLLHPEFLEILGEIRDRGLRSAFDTNGLLLDRRLARELVRLGVGEVGFSIDALDEENYRQVTGRPGLAEVEANLAGLVEERKRSGRGTPLVRVLLVDLPENRSGRQEAVLRWLALADEVVVQTERRGGLTLAVPPPPGERRRPCGHLFRTLFVQWDGLVPICCEDWCGTTHIGRVQDGPLEELWLGSRLEQLRRAHQAGRYGEEPLCSSCQAWVERRTRLRRENGLLEISTPLGATYRRG